MARTNLAYSLVATAPTPAASGTSMVVTAGQGAYFVANSWATVWPASEVPTPANAEIVLITNVASDTLTITRAQQGTSARTIVVGDQIANTITVDDFSAIEQAISAVSNSLSVETAARVSEDAALSNQISVVSQGLSVETAARAAADVSLANAISVVSQALSIAFVSIAVVSNAVSAEASARLSADNQLSNSISVETAARIAADNSLSDRLSILSAKLSTEISAISQSHSALSQSQSVSNAKLLSLMSLLDAGTTGQVLKKQSNTDFDFIWDTDLAGGSSSATVTSTHISALSQSISVLSQQVSVLSNAVSVADAALSVRIDTQSNAISILSAKLSTEISAISQAHSALSQAVSVLSVRVDTISQQVSVLSATGHIIASFQNVDASAVSAGAPVYAFTSANTFKRANASAVATKPVIGLVIDSNIAVSATGRVQTGGYVTLTTGQWDSITGQAGGLTAGSIYYLDVAAGLLKLTAPTTGAVRPVGVALSTTVMQLTLAMVDDYASALSTLSTAISALSVQLSLQISAISQAHSALSQAVSVADAALSVRIDTQSQAISAISQQVSVLSQAHSALSQAVSVLSADHVSLKDRVSALSSKLSTDISAISQAHSALSQAVSVADAALSVRIDTQSQAISVISQQVSALSQSHSALSQAVSLISVRVDGVSDRLSALTSAHNALSNAVSALSVGPGATDQYISLQNQDSVVVSAGAPVYLHTTVSGFGSFKLADASAISAPRHVIGLVTNGSVAVSAVATIRTRDSLSLATAQWDNITGGTGGLSAGTPYYLGTARGTLTTTMPTGSNAAVLVGWGVTTTEMRLRLNDTADWLSDSISVGTATAADLSNKISAVSALVSTAVSALSNSLSVLSAKLSTEISAMSQAMSVAHAALSVRIDTQSQAISVISAGLGGVQLKVIQTSQSISGTGLLKVSGLSVSAAANGIYQIEGFLMHSMSAVSTFGFALSTQTGTLRNAALRWAGGISIGGGAQANQSTFAGAGYFNETGFGSATYSVVGGNAGNLPTKLDGIVAMSTTGGTLQIKAKAGTSGCLTMKEGSFIRAYKIG